MIRKISQTELDAAVKSSLQERLQSMSGYSQLCHGDFNPSNIIVSENGTPYILDWSHAALGDSAADAARTCLLFGLEGSMEGAQKYLELFCSRSSVAKQRIHSWLPVVAACQSIKGNIEEKDFLLKWVNVSANQ